MTFEDHPELAGYEPMPPRHDRGARQKFQRTVVVVAVAALILPGVLGTISVAQDTASNTCAVYVARYTSSDHTSSARFELFAPAGPGWQCYALNTEGIATFVAPLGLIPTVPELQPAAP